MWEGIKRPPNLAARLVELSRLNIPGATYQFKSGRGLIYRMELSPTEASRLYLCELHVPSSASFPKVIVREPDLLVLAAGKKLPHIYPYDGKGVHLCLWKPKFREWNWSMKLSETYVPWTVEWLWYFEDWLYSGVWAGGGDHPPAHRRHKDK